MTVAVDHDAEPSTEELIRRAEHAWFRAGVRRSDRQELAADLRLELDAARAEAVPCDVLGDDPAATAREWAHARGVIDRRLRLLTFVLPALLAAAVAAGAVLALLADAFTGDGETILGDPSPVTILSVYAGGAVLAGLALCTVSGLVLHAQRDSAAAGTVRMLLALLPVGAVSAIAAGVSVADAYDFSTRPRTFLAVCLAVVAVLAVMTSTARWLAVRKCARSQVADRSLAERNSA